MTTIELDARKAQLAREILNVDSIEYISKEEILAGIDAGLKDLKTGRKTSAREFLKELRDEI